MTLVRLILDFEKRIGDSHSETRRVVYGYSTRKNTANLTEKAYPEHEDAAESKQTPDCSQAHDIILGKGLTQSIGSIMKGETFLVSTHYTNF